ncbi:MAG: hypothetical protein DWQ08_04380, partial [Proteobacteria bacterium]
PSYAQAATDFHRILECLDMPLHVLPGNHDVGDKPVDWAPAGVVREEYLALWEEHFGCQYRAFGHEGVRFIVINAQIVNTGLDIEGFQREWIEKELKEHDDERVIPFLHYPPYLCSPGEHENYDNLAEPGRWWITGLIERYRVEAMFTGHVHHFWYHRHVETDCYLPPSTSFTRQDCSEMFRVEPAAAMQYGRYDEDKTGYFVVLVYERGHVCHFRTTRGSMLEAGAQSKPVDWSRPDRRGFVRRRALNERSSARSNPSARASGLIRRSRRSRQSQGIRVCDRLRQVRRSGKGRHRIRVDTGSERCRRTVVRRARPGSVRCHGGSTGVTL